VRKEMLSRERNRRRLRRRRRRGRVRKRKKVNDLRKYNLDILDF
jgi:hypothetical protein